MEGRSGAFSFFDPAVKGVMKAAETGNLRYSNFFLTISTNVVPKNDDEKFAVSHWLSSILDTMFRDWKYLNGVVLKPAGSDNYNSAVFPADHKIVSVNSKISLEQGEAQRGQLHAHVVVEVAHEYTFQEDGASGFGMDGKDIVGVHINVMNIRKFLNHNIPEMQIDDSRKPPKIYVNSQVLTTGTDNSNKFLTYAYINKTTAKDNGGGERNLVADKQRAPLQLQQAHASLVDANNPTDIEGEVDHSEVRQQSSQKSVYQAPKKRK